MAKSEKASEDEKGGTFPSIKADAPGSSGAPRINPMTRQAMFLASVAGDCPCERCCGYRDMASTVINPGQEY